MFVLEGASPGLSPVGSPSHTSVSSGAFSSWSPVEFPDTADFLTKPSINIHKPLGYTISSPDFQQQVKTPVGYMCSRYCKLCYIFSNFICAEKNTIKMKKYDKTYTSTSTEKKAYHFIVICNYVTQGTLKKACMYAIDLKWLILESSSYCRVTIFYRFLEKEELLPGNLVLYF